jgi:hypothetical protein
MALDQGRARLKKRSAPQVRDALLRYSVFVTAPPSRPIQVSRMTGAGLTRLLTLQIDSWADSLARVAWKRGGHSCEYQRYKRYAPVQAAAPAIPRVHPLMPKISIWFTPFLWFRDIAITRLPPTGMLTHPGPPE